MLTALTLIAEAMMMRTGDTVVSSNETKLNYQLTKNGEEDVYD